MTDRSFPAPGISAQFGASLPRFDPLATPSRKAGRRLFALSLLLHALTFLLLADLLFGQVHEPEETVIVRMLEPEPPQPEPPKLQRKVLAQRRIDATVTRFTEVARPEIQRVEPVPVLDQTRKVDVDPTDLTKAPKQVEMKQVVTESVSVFAEVESRAQPLEIDRVSPELRTVQASRASAGPRRLEASGPTPTAKAVDVEAPVVAEGVLSRNAIDGTLEGPRIVVLEAGVSERMLEGRGERGSLTGVERNCEQHPACLAYLEMIKRRVFARWQTPPAVDPGEARFKFRVDRGGSAHGIELRHIDDPSLGESCLAAFRHASPFPPPPQEIIYIVNKNILATFRYGD